MTDFAWYALIGMLAGMTIGYLIHEFQDMVDEMREERMERND